MIKINYCKYCKSEIRNLPYFICKECTKIQMYTRYYKHIPIKQDIFSRAAGYGITLKDRKAIMGKAHRDRNNGVELIELKNGREVRNCRRCGSPVEDFPGYIICTGCIVDEIYETIASGNEPTKRMIINARRRNIDVEEIRGQVAEDEDGVASWVYTNYGDSIACSKCGFTPRTTEARCPNCKRKME